MAERDVVLILTEEFDPHADLMVTMLRERSPEVEVFRFHPDMFPRQAELAVQVTNGEFKARLGSYQRTLDMTRVRSVWVRRPQKPVLDERIPAQYQDWCQAETEAALHGLFHSLDALVVNPREANRVASNKVYQLRVATQLGFHISPTLVCNVPEAARAFYDTQDGEVIFKALSSAMVVKTTPDDAKVVYTRKIPRAAVEGAGAEQIRHVPVQLQRLVRKVLDIRVTVVGATVFAAALKSGSHDVDIRRWHETRPEHSVYQLPPDVAEKCVDLVRRLGLYFGAIDLLLTEDGEHVFLEINPSGQFYWVQHATGLPIMEALAEMLVRGGVEQPCSPA